MTALILAVLVGAAAGVLVWAARQPTRDHRVPPVPTAQMRVEDYEYKRGNQMEDVEYARRFHLGVGMQEKLRAERRQRETA